MQGDSAKWFRKIGQPPKILIADDDPSIQRLIGSYLKDIGELTIVGSGQEATASFQSLLDQNQHFDLVCLDIMMPGLDGRKALSQIRQLEERYGVQNRQRCKAIMISALDAPQDKLKSFREACDAYITKPIDKDQLLRVVNLFNLKTKAAA